jgi:hypothetical protein
MKDCLAANPPLKHFLSGAMITDGQWFERRKPDGSLVICF